MTWHEKAEAMSEETRDRHRALVSLREELEAIDWYDQRIDAARDGELKRILIHHRDEEKEHAVMLLEWLRRKDAVFGKQLKTYLFRDGPVTHHGARSSPESAGGDGSLRIGGLKGGS